MPSPTPAPGSNGRPKSALFSSPSPAPAAPGSPSHNRSHSTNPLGVTLTPPAAATQHGRRDSRSGTPTSTTFAPSFIKAEEAARGQDAVKGIEGENDFSGKRYVWLNDPEEAFVKGWVVEEMAGSKLLVQTDDGTVRITFGASSATTILTAIAATRS